MKTRMLAWLRCPECGTELQVKEPGLATIEAATEINTGTLACPAGHRYPIIQGVPRLIASSCMPNALSDPRGISESFSEEWAAFEYEDRTWAQEVNTRVELALRELNCTQGDLEGKVLLDAGCGNGSLSSALTRYGCEVVAADVSESVVRAHATFHRKHTLLHFVQADLVRNPFKPESFDFIYSSGVLHHNPDTRKALEALLPVLKPGGTCYIWVYQKIPGIRHALKQAFRSVVAPLPTPLKMAIVRIWLPQAYLRQCMRRALGSGRREDNLNWRERLVLLMDHYTPRYRWEHTQEEVHAWYRELGLSDIKTTEVREWGFGVVARKRAMTTPEVPTEALNA